MKRSAVPTWEGKEPETWSWQEVLGHTFLTQPHSKSFIVYKGKLNGSALLAGNWGTPDEVLQLSSYVDELKKIQGI